MDVYLSSKKQIIVDAGPTHFILSFLEAAVKATAITHYSYISLLSNIFFVLQFGVSNSICGLKLT